jgi:hypothetical protein
VDLKIHKSDKLEEGAEGTGTDAPMENNIQNEELLAMVKSKIYTIRGQKVMLDFDLAAMYGVETRVLNQSVKRNIERFPEDFMFQLTKGELDIWKSQIMASNSTDIQSNRVLMSQIVISKPVERRGGTQKPPYAFTENGVAMLSSVLNESTRSQLEAISAALAELQADHRKQPKRKPIGFIQPQDDNDDNI